MKIGIPQEVMTGEGRIALLPDACRAIIDAGHEVYVQSGAGLESGYSDDEFRHAGAKLVSSAEQVYRSARLVVKVKQPLQQDLRHLRESHLLFSYLHLAADPGLISALCRIGLTAIPFESVAGEDGSLPLLLPMSKIAGRIAVVRGASLLFRNRGGRGVLLGGVDDTDSGRVVILGAGVAGSQALEVAVALGASVAIVDIDDKKLSTLKECFPSIETYTSTAETVRSLCLQADLVIGSVLVAGRRAPVILDRSTIEQMNDGSVIVDIAIDQGGCVEGIRATDSEELFYVENGVLHSAVPNMPATVARTASQSLSAAVLPYVLQLAAMGTERLEQHDAKPTSKLLSAAVAISHGQIIDAVLKQEFEHN